MAANLPTLTTLLKSGRILVDNTLLHYASLDPNYNNNGAVNIVGEVKGGCYIYTASNHVQ